MIVTRNDLLGWCWIPFNGSLATQEVKLEPRTWLAMRLSGCYPTYWAIVFYISPEEGQYLFRFRVSPRPRLISERAREWAIETWRHREIQITLRSNLVSGQNHSVFSGSCFQEALKSKPNTDQEVYTSMAVLNRNAEGMLASVEWFLFVSSLLPVM